MRTTFLLITLVTALPVIAFAQAPTVSTNKSLLPGDKSVLPGDARLQQTLPKPVDSDAEFQAIRPLATPTTGQVSKLALEGALVRATRAGQPWQVINPFAPKEFGDDYDNVSLNPITRRPEGVVLLSVRFGKFGRNHK
jgi:hypothetical protein